MTLARTTSATAIMAGLAALVLNTGLSSVLPGIATSLQDARFAWGSRHPTGSVALATIDQQSLDAIGVWPWPRTVEARIVSALAQAGSSTIALDIDLSSHSTEASDAALEAALRAAGGGAVLASERQPLSGQSPVLTLTRPLPRFEANAWTALVDATPDPDGTTRRMPFGARIHDEIMPSMAAILAGTDQVRTGRFSVDFSIDASLIPQVSVLDLLRPGTEAATGLRAKLAGRTVIVAATAPVLKDMFHVPRFGTIAGGVLQAEALETLRQRRVLRPAGPLALTTLSICTLVLGSLLTTTLPAGWAVVALASTSAITELAATLAQVVFALALDTAGTHVTMLVLAAFALAKELRLRHRLWLAARAGQQAAQAKTERLARFDTLTCLPNRNHFMERFGPSAIAPADALALVDIRRFRAVNAAFGHACGDALLLAVAERLRAAAGRDAFVARIGGNEFAILASGPSATDCLAALEPLVAQPYELGSHRVAVGICVGIAALAPTMQADEASRRAGLALTAARQDSNRRICIFTPAMDAALSEQARLERDLTTALREEQFEVYYQVQVELPHGRIIGAEALVRWQHPQRGIIPPDQFIPALERTGQIVDLGTYVLHQACRHAATWPGYVRLAVNAAVPQLVRGDFAETVAEALGRACLAPERLDIELTETLFLQDGGVVQTVLYKLRDQGVGLALDDFGTGYSSLGYIRRFPITKVKIDRSFVQDLPHSRQSMAVVRAVTAITQALDLSAIAEGVETEAHVHALHAAGCGQAQGYLFGRPEPADAFDARLKKGASIIPAATSPPPT